MIWGTEGWEFKSPQPDHPKTLSDRQFAENGNAQKATGVTPRSRCSVVCETVAIGLNRTFACVLIALLLGTSACSDSEPSPPTPVLMKDLVGCTLQKAQDILRDQVGHAPISDDLLGDRRPWQDRNWVVISQRPEPETPITRDSYIRVGIVKHGEREPSSACLSR